MKKIITLMLFTSCFTYCSGQNITDSLSQSTYVYRFNPYLYTFEEPVSALPYALAIVACLLLLFIIFVYVYDFITNKILKNKP